MGGYPSDGDGLEEVSEMMNNQIQHLPSN